jgi:hypothetical protein
MGLFKKIAGSSEARSTYRDAKNELERVGRGRSETAAFHAANRAVIQAEQDLPRWRRGSSS